MPATLIHIVDGNWTAEVANTSISYTFQGGSLSAQRTSVTEFAGNLFNHGQQNMNDFFETTDSEDLVAEQLFANTDTLVYQEAVIFVAETSGPEVPVLIDFLEEVGDALLVAI
ncbi:hypothetical protein ACFPTX_18860 [Pseudomonas sp. GCM10022188]|uniref:hypothetical protein n=1 Tax=Pseudomonas TaxID=286 RepID=UPI001E2E66C4|nr:hypothetical protein [Pseudomonas oryzagri]MCC6075868.1 hypothetical protein [Pseudomonas oryzagri]